MITLDLDLFNNNENYLCKINLPENITGTSSSDFTTIVILDNSGSMYGSIDKITKLFLPELFTKLNYMDNQPITLITFSNTSEIVTYDFSEVKKGLYIDPNGGTYMTPALENLKNFLENFNINKNIRILTISDGELFDQENTVKYSNEVVKVIKQKDLLVNSQAIRFFTSSSQPDTRGLSSCLQFSNVSNPILIDIKAEDYNYENYDEMFKSDGFENNVALISDNDSIKVEPWENFSNKIIIRKGENIFWLKKEDGDKLLKGDNLLKIADLKDGQKVSLKINLKDKISYNNYQNIISDKINFYMKKLKILKILGSQKSLEEMDKIINFFEDFENKLVVKEEIQKLDNSLNSRLILISKQIEKKKVSVANKMAQIKNDEKIAQLNSQQQAEYLRKIDFNDKTSKALAKRAFVSGLDFDETAKKEVIEISKHINELDEIDGDKLNISFYSTCNTLDGIRLVSKLPENKEIFEDITANDIIKLLNIVGIAAYAATGNYPDPMTYRLEKIYPSTFISVSDILTAYEVSNGQNLTEISNKQNIISTCVPYFEDERIHKFLLKYAPHLLEFTTSIGMRKIISEVPYTYEYNLLAGYWKMIEVLLKDKSEINIKTFINFAQNYKLVAKSHFEYVIPLVENQKKSPKTVDSIYIANNGITNMTYPLIELILREKTEIDRDFIQKIIRATYQFEVYQYIRKLIRKQNPDTTNDFIRNSLIELLNIDIEKNRTKLNPLFESDDNLPIYEDYVPNIEISKKKYLKNIFWLDNIVAVPILLKAALDEKNPVEKIKNIPNNLLSDDFIKKELGIEYDLDLFRFNCIIQCFLYREKADRCDSEKKRMLISDLFYNIHFDKVIKKFVKKLFQEEFQKDKNKKIKEEINFLKDEIVQKLLEVDNINDFINLLNKGIKKGQVEIIILNPDSIGYNDLMNKLLDVENKDIPLRNEKLFIMLTGRNENSEAVWNQGNFLRDTDKIKKAKNILDEKLLEKYNEMRKTSGIHIYRGGADKRNRHGHSNDLPSYWAYGYQSVSEMANCENYSFMENYYKNHIGCCGLGSDNLSYTKKRKLGKKEGSIGGASYHSGD
jgi:hypothetical protein